MSNKWGLAKFGQKHGRTSKPHTLMATLFEANKWLDDTVGFETTFNWRQNSPGHSTMQQLVDNELKFHISKNQIIFHNSIWQTRNPLLWVWHNLALRARYVANSGGLRGQKLNSPWDRNWIPHLEGLGRELRLIVQHRKGGLRRKISKLQRCSSYDWYDWSFISVMSGSSFGSQWRKKPRRPRDLPP